LEKPANLDGQSLWPVLTGQCQTLDSRKPMIWVFPEYGGQVAVRIGNFKLVRQGLKTKTPGAWEVYDLAQDRAEANDLAATRADLIQQAEQLLRREVSENAVFPVPTPSVNTP
jgi:arylsulfatase A-like enzyme